MNEVLKIIKQHLIKNRDHSNEQSKEPIVDSDCLARSYREGYESAITFAIALIEIAEMTPTKKVEVENDT